MRAPVVQSTYLRLGFVFIFRILGCNQLRAPVLASADDPVFALTTGCILDQFVPRVDDIICVVENGLLGNSLGRVGTHVHFRVPRARKWREKIGEWRANTPEKGSTVSGNAGTKECNVAMCKAC